MSVLQLVSKRIDEEVQIMSAHKTQLKLVKIQRLLTDRMGKTPVKDGGIYT
jgi:hypothetical protein